MSVNTKQGKWQNSVKAWRHSPIEPELEMLLNETYLFVWQSQKYWREFDRLGDMIWWATDELPWPCWLKNKKLLISHALLHILSKTNAAQNTSCSFICSSSRPLSNVFHWCCKNSNLLLSNGGQMCKSWPSQGMFYSSKQVFCYKSSTY